MSNTKDKTVNPPLTWDKLADEYNKCHTVQAKVQPMKDVWNWAESRTDLFVLNPDGTLSRKPKFNSVNLTQHKEPSMINIEQLPSERKSNLVRVKDLKVGDVFLRKPATSDSRQSLCMRIKGGSTIEGTCKVVNISSANSWPMPEDEMVEPVKSVNLTFTRYIG